ncbi:rhomboid family intramembrane serine protease [Nocardia sp. NPDC052566]|uniref:rhomboid family intramembrane serine protease n=1 Tax=Nocardia sp. NPDC052566 TaxID=3364330 RepID=UPI0037CA1020
MRELWAAKPTAPFRLDGGPIGESGVDKVHPENQVRSRAAVPIVTYVLIAVNALVYLAEIAYPRIVDQFSTLGRGLMKDGQLYVYDGKAHPGFELVGIDQGEWYRLITGSFLHQEPSAGFGVLHVVFNMMWLFMFGRMLEPALGRVWFALLYLLSALGGGVLVYQLAPDTSAIGASGAIYGLAAAYFVLSRRMGMERADARNLLIYFVVWLVISAPFASWQGHLGGFVAGGAVGLIYLLLGLGGRARTAPPAHP